MTKRFDIFGKRDAPSAAKHRAKRRPPARTVKKSRSRKARICHGQRRDNGNGNGGSCRGAPLGQLSDDLIGHIVSFLPFRDAVRTSILSRRWRYAWTQITRFDLCPGTVLSYAAAVAAYTVNADNYRDISFPIDVAASVLDFILSALPPVTIVSLRIMSPPRVPEEVHWDIVSPDGILDTKPLSSSLLSIKTLTTLVVDGAFSISSPPVIACPVLHSLKLAHAALKDDLVERILSSCENLESLTLEDCSCDGSLSLNIRHQNLSRLILIPSDKEEKYFIDAPRLVEFDLRVPGYSCFLWEFICLGVPKLERLTLTLSASTDLHGLGDLSALACKLKAVVETVAGSCNANIRLEGDILECLCFCHGFRHFPIGFQVVKTLVVNICSGVPLHQESLELLSNCLASLRETKVNKVVVCKTRDQSPVVRELISRYMADLKSFRRLHI